MSEEPFDPDNPDEDPIVDDPTFTKLAGIIGDGPDGIESLVGTFSDTAPETIEAMRTAAADEDMKSLSEAAHKLKGEAGTFGARRLQALCKRLELDAREDDVSDPSARVEAVAKLFEETTSQLESRL